MSLYSGAHTLCFHLCWIFHGRYLINSGFDQWSSWKAVRPGNHQEVQCVKGQGSKAQGSWDVGKGTGAAIMWHRLPGQGLGGGDLLG